MKVRKTFFSKNLKNPTQTRVLNELTPMKKLENMLLKVQLH